MYDVQKLQVSEMLKNCFYQASSLVAQHGMTKVMMQSGGVPATYPVGFLPIQWIVSR